MNSDDYKQVGQDLYAILDELDEFRPKDMTPNQRETHQRIHAVVYLAIVRLENKKFSDLNEASKKVVDALNPSIKKVKEDTEKSKGLSEKLAVIDGMLGIFKTLIAILS